MRYLTIILAVTVIAVINLIMNAKADYKQISKLNNQFNRWLENSCETERPSNAVFEKLFTQRYGFSSSVKAVYSENAAFIFKQYADIVASFPSKHEQLIADQLSILDNLEDYYRMIYRERRTIRYWINFVIYLPRKIVKYLNLNPDSSGARLFNVIYWIGSIIWAVIEDKIVAYISSLIP